MMEKVEDSRLAKPNLCRATTMVAGREFICIKEAHAPIYNRHSGRTRDVFNGFVSNNESVYQHHYVRRYPFGDH